MPRIYLDTNVFSNLRNNITPVDQQLNLLLEQFKNNLTIVFSHAHIRDKLNDKSDMKSLDFEFMENLVGDNYLSYHGLEKRTSFYLATPKMVFDDEQGDNIEVLSNVFEEQPDDDELTVLRKRLTKNIFSSVKVPIDQIDLNLLPKGHMEIMSQIIPTRNSSLFDLMNQVKDLSIDVLTDNTTYKKLREIIDAKLNNGSLTLNGEENLNELFQDSTFRKTYVDLVKDSITIYHKDEIPYNDFYLQSYTKLDMLGVNKDKLNQKNTFRNIFNDSLHSYYARYCDYLITKDKRLIEKSQALYEIYGVYTKILSPQQFLDVLSIIGPNNEENMSDFFSKFAYDIKNTELQEPIIVEDEVSVYRVF